MEEVGESLVCKVEITLGHLFSSGGLKFMKDFKFFFFFLILSLPFTDFFFFFFLFFFCPALSPKKAISLSKKELINQINQSVLLRNYKAHVKH